MIGKVIMEISNAEMRAAVQYYLNSDLFFSRHKARVTEIVGRSNGRYTIRFEGSADPDFVEPQRVDDALVAGAGRGD